MPHRRLPLIALLVVALLLVAPTSADAQTPGTLRVTPGVVEVGQPFTMTADGCPGPLPVGADYRVEFDITYLPPPQLPGAPFPGSYSVTLGAIPLGNETFIASWAIPQGAPTLGGSYRVAARCIANELGGEFVWFDYQPVGLTLVSVGPVIGVSKSSVTTGERFTVTAWGCPGPIAVGADYRVEYRLRYIPPPERLAAGLLGEYDRRFSVPGNYGDHALEIVIPVGAPTVGGNYQLSAECWGNELGSDFLWHAAYAPVRLRVGQGAGRCADLAVTVYVADGQIPTTGDDVMLGSPSADEIYGLGGDDTICGGGGDDVLRGGPGDDVLRGNVGHDLLRGGPGDDLLGGGRGEDRLHGHRGRDAADGHARADVIRGGRGRDSLAGGGGPDLLDGGPHFDTGDGGPDVDTCINLEQASNCEN